MFPPVESSLVRWRRGIIVIGRGKTRREWQEKCASGCRGIESEGTSIVSAKKKRKRNGSRDPISVSMDQNLGDEGS